MSDDCKFSFTRECPPPSDARAHSTISTRPECSDNLEMNNLSHFHGIRSFSAESMEDLRDVLPSVSATDMMTPVTVLARTPVGCLSLPVLGIVQCTIQSCSLGVLKEMVECY